MDDSKPNKGLTDSKQPISPQSPQKPSVNGRSNSQSPQRSANENLERSENKKRSVSACDREETNSLSSSVLTNPSSVLIITNIVDRVFTVADDKIRFEAMFRQFDGDAQFQYLKTFHRARVSFESVPSATAAHDALDGREWLGEKIRCYYAQTMPTGLSTAGGCLSTDDDGHLKVPPPSKQYLISPPSSPPPEWEVIPEREPAVNYDLIAAIKAMGPSQSYEVHSGTPTQPSIIVHLSDDPDGYDQRPTKIQQTRRPDNSKPES